MDYSHLSVHRLMVRDEARTSAFAQAIAAVVRPGDVVLDVGAGSGILSLFAARAGAARVYAVERQVPTAAFATALVERNGFGGVVRVLTGDVRKVAIPERVDVIVSEWMGAIGVDENMYGAVLWARDNLMKDGGRVVPAAVTAFAAPVSCAQRPDAAYFLERPYGLDLAMLSEPVVHEVMMMRRQLAASDMAAAPQPLWTTTAATDTPDVVRNPFVGEVVFAPTKEVAPTALALWFSADLGGGVTLTNAPNAPDTHWSQSILPLSVPVQLKKGDKLKVRVTLWPVGPGPLMLAWRWSVNDGPTAQLDTAGGSGPPEPATETPEFTPGRSELSQFLAGLAMDPDALAKFLADPEAGMAGLSPANVEALKSQDPDRIGMALYAEETAS